MFLENIGHPSTVSNPVELKNLDGKVEAIAFTVGQNGYIVVNINDLSIPELSLENPNPFANCEKPIYNGPLQYYYESGGQIKSLVDNSTVDITQIDNCYKKEKISNLNDYIAVLALEYDNDTRAATTERYLSASLAEWAMSGGICAAIAAAICIKFMYDNVSYVYIDSNSDYIYEGALINLMNQYLGGPGVDAYELRDGLNAYFNDRHINNSAVITNPLTFNTVKQSINSNRPLIIGTHDHPTYGDHCIVAHGYFQSRVDGNYIIINDGARHNNVWIEPDMSTLTTSVGFAN